MSTVSCHQLSFSWQDGSPVLDHLDATIGSGRTGLVGLNGSGKSTLLRLVAGELAPTGGSLTVDGAIGYLPQDLNLRGTDTVSDLLGITTLRHALAAMDAGVVTEEHLTIAEGHWDIEERSRAALDRISLRPGRHDEQADVLDRTVSTLSGGESVLTALIGLQLLGRPITLLDEPTNNLDRQAREILYAMLDAWSGALIVISHDRKLLEHVDQIAELRDGALRTFTGTYADYVEAIATEQHAAERMARASEAVVRREKKQLAEARTKLDRRKRYADKDYVNKRRPKMIMQARKREAQVSAGKHRIMQTEKLDMSLADLEQAQDALRDDDDISIDLPDTEVPERRVLLELRLPQADRATAGALTIRGPQRVALVGPNGSGKTSLLRMIHDGGRSDFLSRIRPRVPAPTVGYLDQHLDSLDDAASVLDNVRQAAPALTVHDARAGLARFLIRGDSVHLKAASLSGGERFRVSLACLLLASPAPQLLLLDEPTNNLDLSSLAQLVTALQSYRGGLLIASHDHQFLDEIGVTDWWLMEHGSLTRLPGDG